MQSSAGEEALRLITAAVEYNVSLQLRTHLDANQIARMLAIVGQAKHRMTFSFKSVDGDSAFEVKLDRDDNAVFWKGFWSGYGVGVVAVVVGVLGGFVYHHRK